MPTSAGNPLDALAAPPPSFTEAEARAVAAEYYGLTVDASPIVSERDQNFLLETPDGTRYVLKIANAAEDPRVTDFQVDALRHVAAQGPGRVAVPRILETRDGRSRFTLEGGCGPHVTRVVTWLDGDMPDPGRLSARLCRDLGAALAWLGGALSDFTHEGAHQELPWDLGQAPALRTVLGHIGDRELRDRVAAIIDDFEQHAAAHYVAQRAQVVHNDMNPGNVLVHADNAERCAGVIDFGDMLHAPLVSDVAVAASYLRAPDGDPLTFIAEFVAGYHGAEPLARAEIDLLYDLINTRLAATVAILHWRVAEKGGDDPYSKSASATEASAARFLKCMRELPREHVGTVLRQVCASVSAPAQPAS